jgi:hypothetical protein
MSGGDGMNCCQVRVGSYGHVLSCQVLSVAASRGLGAANSYPFPKAPRCVDRMAGPCPGSRREAGKADRWQNPACSRLSEGGSVKAWIALEFSSF